MLTVEVLDVQGFGPAIRGMRNPMNSWDKSDSELCKGAYGFDDCHISPIGECPRNNNFEENIFCIGPNDLDLMRRLFQAGTEHRKYARMIQVYLNITAPLYWWKEFDTYKVGTVCNSCSTMHKIHAKEFTIEDFSVEHLMGWDEYEHEVADFFQDRMCNFRYYMMDTISALNNARDLYLLSKTKPMKEESKRPALVKKFWWQMIQLLPTSYNQTRTVMLSYENAFTIRRQRKNHKLDEWHTLCDALLNLPYYREITGEE